MRGGDKLDLPQPISGLQREQQRQPLPPHHLPTPPPHRAWEQQGQMYDSHPPPQGHPLMPLAGEHSLRFHNGGYGGVGGPLPNPHHLANRPNHILKVSLTCEGDFTAPLCIRQRAAKEIIPVCVSLGVLRSHTFPGAFHCLEMIAGLRCTR